ncbi:electron transfer flavoprotein subunit beta/FixA family protein [Nesterenkonia sp. MY13]|uniref:Electron transfer flavoprotein subunit beta n=1 Tax=Nesterenkonia sedimenti TaxID=1463632 RepID=A0A7X8TKX3_9MICC|nr:electron transfer flavoprotein subunit beta/FixA family protein [Nesterenkonia sedimenti]
MHILTLVKWVPDAQLERTIGEDRRVERTEGVLGELDEYPIEAALQIREALEKSAPETTVRVTALIMGPDGASTALKKALQIGADEGFHLDDEQLAAADIYATSAALAGAITHIHKNHDADSQLLVLTGMASEDGESGAVPAQLAQRLGGLAALTQATSLTVESDRVVVDRVSGNTRQKVAAGLPAVVSVTDQANEPRYPNFKAIMKARKKPVTTLSLADLGLTAIAVQSKISLIAAEPRPEREAGQIIHDDGTAGTQLADYLEKEGLL